MTAGCNEAKSFVYSTNGYRNTHHILFAHTLPAIIPFGILKWRKMHNKNIGNFSFHNNKSHSDQNFKQIWRQCIFIKINEPESTSINCKTGNQM